MGNLTGDLTGDLTRAQDDDFDFRKPIFLFPALAIE
jgi:hypothetical protein